MNIAALERRTRREALRAQHHPEIAAAPLDVIDGLAARIRGLAAAHPTNLHVFVAAEQATAGLAAMRTALTEARA